MTVEAGTPRRSLGTRVAIGVATVAVFATLVSLGVWQVRRLAWKQDLIARVDARVHAAPEPPPAPADWPGVTAAADEYRHVRLSGTFLNDREAFVQAVTAYGAGWWVLTPLRAPDGTLTLVNRGFVPPDKRDPATRAAGQLAGEATVTGLLRMPEPGGAFLRSNDPAADRWFSRDVAAIAAARHLGSVAPFFIDADASPVPGGLPIGGLTVISFSNSHLIYAITWFSLAALLAGAVVTLALKERRRP